MRKQLFLLIFMLTSFLFAKAQTMMNDSLLKAKDSTLRAAIHQDSIKIEKDFIEKAKWEKLKSQVQYPVLKAGDFSGFIPVKDADEIPDPNIDYKLLFELTYN